MEPEGVEEVDATVTMHLFRLDFLIGPFAISMAFEKKMLHSEGRSGFIKESEMVEEKEKK